MPWTVALLPFIEQSALWAEYCPDVALDDNTAGTPANNQGKNRSLGQVSLKTQSCPSDAYAGKPTTPATYDPKMEFRISSYRGIGGRVGSWANWWWETGGHATLPNYRGIFHLVGRTNNGGTLDLTFESFASVIDGTSNTAMISERHTPRDAETQITAWASPLPHRYISTTAAYSPTFKATDSHERCKTMFAAVAAGGMDAATTGSWICLRSYGSYHPGGVNTCLADGSVFFVPETTNPSIWAAYATISNGEMVGTLR